MTDAPLDEHTIYVLEDRGAVRNEIIGAAQRYCRTMAKQHKPMQAFKFEGYGSTDDLVSQILARQCSSAHLSSWSLIADYVMVTPLELERGGERKPASLVALGELLQNNFSAFQDCVALVVYSARTDGELIQDAPFRNWGARSLADPATTPSLLYLPKTGDTTGDVATLVDGLRYVHAGESRNGVQQTRQGLSSHSRSQGFNLATLLKNQEIQDWLQGK